MLSIVYGAMRSKCLSSHRISRLTNKYIQMHEIKWEIFQSKYCTFAHGLLCIGLVQHSTVRRGMAWHSTAYSKAGRCKSNQGRANPPVRHCAARLCPYDTLFKLCLLKFCYQLVPLSNPAAIK